MRKATSLQMEGNSSERWASFISPKCGSCSWGCLWRAQVCTSLTLGSAHGAQQGFASTANSSSLKLKEILWVIPSAKVPKKFLLSPANNPGQGRPDSCSKQSSKEDVAEQKPALGLFMHIYTCVNAVMLLSSNQTGPKIPIPISCHHPNQPQAPEVTWPKHYFC